MASFNSVTLMGNLTRDPELRYTPSGAAVATLGLAVNRRYKDSGGSDHEETLFIDVVVWNKQAESCGQYLKKGRLVLVAGRLQQRTWESPEGQKRSKHEVVAERVQFLPSGSGHGNGAGAQPSAEVPSGEEVPF
jgi:single-strand DNA-binding protein